MKVEAVKPIAEQYPAILGPNRSVVLWKKMYRHVKHKNKVKSVTTILKYFEAKQMVYSQGCLIPFWERIQRPYELANLLTFWGN